MDRDEFIDLLTEELSEDPDNNRLNRILEAADEYAENEKAQLSCEDITKGTTSDTISRQAAIDAIVNCTNCGDEKTLRTYVAKHSLDNGWTGGVLEAIDAIENLPPAQPEPEHTMEEFMYGQDLGSLEDGSL